MFRAILISILFAFLAACVEMPDVDVPRRTAGTGAYPTLVALDMLGRPLSAAEQKAADEAAMAVQARTAALNARAAILRGPVPDNAALERLRARLAE